MKTSLVEGLKEYFKNTSKEQVLKDWEEFAHLDGPIEGQMIWVRESDIDPWMKAEFVRQYKTGEVECYSENKKVVLTWDEYSLTDPSK